MPLARFALIVVLVCVGTTAQAGKMYKWVDEQGKIHYSETPPTEGKILSKSGTSKRAGRADEKYCDALRNYALKVARAMRRRVPVGDVIASVGGVEQRAIQDGELDAPVLRQVAYYVYGFAHGSASPAEIAGLVQGQCLKGVYGSTKTAKSGSGSNPDGDAKDGDRASGSMGTGWVAGRNYVVTNYHVVRGYDRISVILADGEKSSALVDSQDPQNDVAILRVLSAGDMPPGLPLAPADSAIGSEVFTIGFPHTDIMGVKPKLTTGIINALTGLQDDVRTYQISVPLQSGNSGGPLVNKHGEVVGIVTAKLSATAVFKWTGDLPQNVNYAIKSRYVASLLHALPAFDGDRMLPRQAGSLEDLAARVQDSVVRVVAE